jgi:hypothetical protein
MLTSVLRLPLALLLTVSVTASCASDSAEPTPLTWEEFQAMAVQEPDTGLYIVNGDEPVDGLEQLREMYERYLESHYAAHSDIARDRSALIVNTVNGADDKWSASQAQNLTYCVSKKQFGSRYASVVSALDSATAAWEAVANVNFVHLVAQDDNCTSRNNNVVFNVGYVCRGSYLARAFFPSSSRRSREVLVDCTSWGNISPWTLQGVLRHELGHTLGFRHEHTRPEAGTCFENNSWRALTAYDSSSVMHYPQCNGDQTGDLVLTNLDKAGAATLYP